MTYDSWKDTLEHIQNVQLKIHVVVQDLLHRAIIHDASKLQPPEKEVYDSNPAQLSTIEYGTNDYKSAKDKVQVALNHHYSVSPHHPEYYIDGVDGMNFLDLLEMLVDWKCSTERTKNGDLKKSIEINAEQFNMSEQLKQILLNTASYLEWI